MKAACIILTVVILVAIMAVCVMVKYATDVTVEETSRSLAMSGSESVVHLGRSMGVFALKDYFNSSIDVAKRFPYLAAITRNSTSTWSIACFASIILVKWVITSAHCKKHGSTHKALLYYDFSNNMTITHPILFWRLHDKFNSSEPTAKYDIAVAKLNVDLYPIAIKSSLVDKKKAEGIEASVWKTVWAMDKKIYLTNDMQRLEVRIAKIGKCFESFGVDFDESLICVDLSDHDNCFINEFGPIYSGDTVVGVLALKPRDCDTKLAIFTNVSFYADWILKSTFTTH